VFGLNTRRDMIVTDEHLINIETKLLHQEHTIAELNDALTSQQSQIANLELLVNALRDRVRVLSEAASADGTQEEVPPHY